MRQDGDSVENVSRPFPRLRVLLISALVFCVLAISVTLFALSLTRPYVGAGLSLGRQGWAVHWLSRAGLAYEAGIKKGDKPLEVNSQPATLFLKEYEASRMVHPRLVQQLTAVNEEGQVISVSLQGKPLPRTAFFESVSLFLVTLFFWIVGLYVFVKKPKNSAALLFCLFSLGVGLAFTSALAAERDIPTALSLEVTAFAFIPWLLGHFFLVLPGEGASPRKRFLAYLFYLPSILILLLYLVLNRGNRQLVPPFRSVLILSVTAGFITAAVVLFYSYFHTVSPRTKQQLKIILVTSMAGLLPFTLLSLLPEGIRGQSLIAPEFNVLFVVFIPLGLGYALATQRLMDIDLVIRRGIVYGLVTTILAVVFFISLVMVMVSWQTKVTMWQVGMALGLSAIAALLFGPVKDRIAALSDKFLYKDRYDYRQMVQAIDRSLASLRDFAEMARFLVVAVAKTLDIADAILLVRSRSGDLEVAVAQGAFIEASKQAQLMSLLPRLESEQKFPYIASRNRSDVAFFIPLMAAGQEVGFLCLGHKASQRVFSVDDMYLLHDLTRLAAASLHSAMLARDITGRDAFVSIASHELRTPMTTIMGYAELLLRRNPPEATRRKWLNLIYQDSQRLTAIVDDMLNVSRIQSGKLSVSLGRLGLEDVVEEALEPIRPTTDRHDFVVEIARDIPPVVADRDKLVQVMTNLLSNAVKYSPKGGRITVSARYEPERERVVVGVADQGIGITPPDQERLFTTFHRIRRSETEGVRGTGLGLYIVKEMVELMRGEVWLESELDRGSTFYFSVPTQYPEERDQDRARFVLP